MSSALAPHLHLLLEVSDEPMLLVRSDGLVVGANAAMGRQLRVPWQTLSGSRLADLLDTNWDGARLFLQRACGARQSTIGALAFRLADGGVFDSRCYGNLVQPAAAGAAAAGAAAIACLRCVKRSNTLSPFLRLNQRLDQLTREIALRQQAEQRLQDLNRDLEARVQQEVAAREQAQAHLAQSQRMEALGQLAAGVAHDFNNVLQAVSGGLALIEKRADDRERVTQLARMAMRAAERGVAITGRLLAFSRRTELRAEPVEIGPLLTELQEMLAPSLGTAVTIRIRIDPDTPVLNADRAQLETALINLVVNARDAMGQGGEVTIAAGPDVIAASAAHPSRVPPGHYVRLAVADPGAGMDAATLARAAEPFFTTKPVGEGTGLGLAMARGFAQQSGGGLAIESAPGRGTTVTLWLPQSRPAGPVAAGPEIPAPSAASPVRVLLADDDALVREVLACGLEDHGYRVVQVPNGIAALARLEKGEAFDLLITDFLMPGMNGLTLIDEARRRCSTLPAVLLTGHASPAVQSALENGASPPTWLMRKPIRSEELAEQVAALLAGAAQI